MPLTKSIVVMISLLAASSPLAAQRPFEPDPELARGPAALHAFVDPATDTLVEAEAPGKGPATWQPVSTQWLRIGCSGGAALALRGPGEAQFEVDVPVAGRYQLWVRSHGADGKEEFVTIVRDAENKRYLTAYGAQSPAPRLPRKADYGARRRTANHSHY